ncbi:hypothetical protein WI29_30100 [Burkholderia ubonensis]|uniref:Uncharacterized protein n=1 Tax=Burkholderia ubonensis TaxID=101571 RepID=A0A102JP21_9BURK|nr:hypothetical protein WI31_23940 [Burkholderia ubonensis]KUZ12102.1 hypothetical protein WI29_30100 [Burkholderia ubonensis]KUZ35468.1 hypothetical protein WI30_10035 [Burkholderia ubonensis]KUZ38991.1 hypothetical protein WI32_10070 [Burkholderia ubonensis]KUZ45455.1 hypothetical protein WI33_25800 [Burkholderia ubonensis]
MKGFSGKVAAITGAGSGMGRSLAVELARRGCEVALSDQMLMIRHVRRARARNLQRAHAPGALPTPPTKDPA